MKNQSMYGFSWSKWNFPQEINIFSLDSLPSKYMYIIWISMSDHDTFYIETDIIEPKKGFINVLQ